MAIACASQVHHRHKFDANKSTSYGFCLDVLNIIFEMREADAAMVTQVQDWSKQQPDA
jgi:hypothetical protein